jgi:hypothetical protein
VVEDLFADELGRVEALGLRREVLAGVACLPFRKRGKEKLQELVDSVAGGGRDRDELVEELES